MKFVKILLLLCFSVLSLGAFQTINLDKEDIKISLKNNHFNLLRFPFIVQEAKKASEFPEDFRIVSVKNNAVVILPTVNSYKETADIFITALDGTSYIFSIDAKGKENIFNFVSNLYKKVLPIEAQKFETGIVERDIKNIIKKLVLGKKIPGYKFIRVKRIFETPDIEIQKDSMFDGGKYRAEVWYIKNKTNSLLVLDYDNFYTPGILAISFEKKEIKPGEVIKMWLIVNKATIYKRIKEKQLFFRSN